MTDIDTVELKPCPFCGGENVSSEGIVESAKGQIHCSDCGAFGPHPFYDAIEPTPSWNTRTIAALPPAVPEDDAFKAGQFAAADAIAKQCWNDGVPPKPYGTEWFIAKLDDGSKVVLRELHENHSYDYTTRDETYLAEFRVVQWMQFPDSGFIPYHSPAVPATTPDPVSEAAKVLLACLPNYAMERAALESQARDDEGEFPPLTDLLDFSGQNKSYTVIREALSAALRALTKDGEAG